MLGGEGTKVRRELVARKEQGEGRQGGRGGAADRAGRCHEVETRANEEKDEK